MRKVIHILIFMVCVAQWMQAQNRMQIITRVTERTFTFKNDFLLEINAEKANIIITKSDTRDVKVNLKQVVKNTSKAVAEKHMDAHKFSFKKERERLLVRNYIMFQNNNNDAASRFSSIYTIALPENSFLKITNTLGDVQLTDLNGKVSVAIEYGKLVVNNSSIDLNGKINIGDLQINNSMVNTNLELNNIITRISSSGGNFEFQTSFGSFSLVSNPAITNFNLKAENTGVTLVNKENILFDYYIKSKNGTINLLTDEQLSSDGDYVVYKTESQHSVGKINITAEYGDISIY